ncbi:acyl-CoA dehydrogenase family protein [Cytobacillus kochii]|uniref:acyl-CoA dehydrogenase family protein n=1 Tax=Cytobacillus kochii TaxID=859143 RepID=UPI002E1BFE1D|nr:acyl-CoA dehydrogenase family protein [Cytobacillus kochii]MED1606895.1 acyl-CoA dehydrogenase family protein [Cytobacillus kochii]
MKVNQILTINDGIQVAHSLGEVFKNQALESELLCRQTKVAVEALKNSGVVRLLQPKEFDGHELNFETFFKVMIELSKHEPSSGWVSSLYTMHSWMLCHWPLQAQKEVWETTPNALISSALATNAKQQIVEGGIRITGTWNFSSGIDYADWVMVGGVMSPQLEKESPTINMYLVHKSDFQVVRNWEPIGMRGTGSNQVNIENVVVPAHRFINIVPWSQGKSIFHSPHNNKKIYNRPLYTVIPISLAVVTIGATKGALEIWSNMLKESISAFSEKLSNFTHQQIRLAEVSATIDSAEQLLKSVVYIVDKKREFSLEERAMLRRNIGYSTRLCHQAMQTLFLHSGAASTSVKHPLQRYWRDVQVLAMHLGLNFDWMGEVYGKSVLGLELDPKDQSIC